MLDHFVWKDLRFLMAVFVCQEPGWLCKVIAICSFYWSKWHKYIFWSPISASIKLIFESKLLSTNFNEWVRSACHAAEVNSLSTEAFLFKTESSPGMRKCVLCHCHTTTQIQSYFYFNDQSNSMCENIYTFIFLHNVPVKRLRESPYFVNWEIFNLLSHWVAMVFSSVFLGVVEVEGNPCAL